MTSALGPAGGVDLAQEPDFRLGALLVSPSAARVGSDAGEQHVEPRVMQVLVFLVGQAGRTVTRDQLIDACWGGRIVSDDAVNRVLAQVRALGRSLDPAPFVLETVPKVGVRLIAETSPAEAPVLQPRSVRRPVAAYWAAAIGVLAAAGLLIGLWGVWGAPGKPSRPEAPRVAVLSLSATDPSLKLVAADVQDQIVGALSRNGVTPLPGEGADAAAKVSLVVDGHLQSHDDRIVAALRIRSGSDQSTLWSGAFERRTTEEDGLPKEMAAKVSDIVACGLSTFAPGVHLDNATRALYLSACDGSREWSSSDQVFEKARRVAAAAPDFAPGLAYMAVSGVLALPALPPDQRAGVRAEAGAAADRAMKIDPDFPDSYIAKSLLVTPPNNWLSRERWLVRGASRSRSASIQSYLSDLLSAVGRLDDALLYARRSLMLDPSSPAKTNSLIARLLDKGEFTEASTLQHEAERIWPNSSATKGMAFTSVAFSEPAEGLRLLDNPLTRPPEFDDQGVTAWRSFVLARKARSAGAEKQAADELLAATSAHALTSSMTMRALMTLGQVDAVDAFYRQRFAAGGGADTTLLFGPEAAGFRHSPAFVRLAHDIGLAAYWRTTGKWPDFCREPGLPYSCKTAFAQ